MFRQWPCLPHIYPNTNFKMVGYKGEINLQIRSRHIKRNISKMELGQPTADCTLYIYCTYIYIYISHEIYRNTELQN